MLAAPLTLTIPAWVVIGLIVVVLLVIGIVHVLGALAAAATGVTVIKNLLSIKQMLAGRQTPLPSNLDRPIDLVGPAMLSGIAANPLMARVSAVVAATLLARKGANTLPQQYVTPLLATRWATNPLPLLPGIFIVTELHARPIAPTAYGNRMLVWFRAMNNAASLVEYWTFVCTVGTASLPPQCPSCGAPTAGNNTNSCRFCSATLWKPGPGARTYWLVDDISTAPPASLAA